MYSSGHVHASSVITIIVIVGVSDVSMDGGHTSGVTYVAGISCVIVIIMISSIDDTVVITVVDDGIQEKNMLVIIECMHN